MSWARDDGGDRIVLKGIFLITPSEKTQYMYCDGNFAECGQSQYELFLILILQNSYIFTETILRKFSDLKSFLGQYVAILTAEFLEKFAFNKIIRFSRVG